MKILYGVQGTGNGHLARARLLADAFTARDIQVDYVFSGRAPDRYFDMQVFGEYQSLRGLTFATRNGKVSRWHTVTGNNPLTFINDLIAIKPMRYDLVLTDYEPISAWRSKFSGTPSLGMGHQYAFHHNEVPMPPGDPVARLLLKHFAPVDHFIGVHWHHFGGPILPPLVDTSLKREKSNQPFTLVYMPFDELDELLERLHAVKGERFELYHPRIRATHSRHNVRLNVPSHDGFKEHLCQAARVVCSTGFELISEALYLGLPILTQPVPGQFEQQANALALEQLKLATVCKRLSAEHIADFLHQDTDHPAIDYPDVAGVIADYCLSDISPDLQSQGINERLWHCV